MTIPTLPAEKNTGDALDQTHVARTTRNLEYHGESKPLVRVDFDQISPFSIATSTVTRVRDQQNWDTVVETPTETFWDSVDPDRITVPVSARYDLVLAAYWDSSDTDGTRRLGYRLNESETITWVTAVDGFAGIAQSGSEGCKPFTAGDTLDYVVFQSSGSNLVLNSCWWTLRFVSELPNL